jgi:hypothetical protein
MNNKKRNCIGQSNSEAEEYIAHLWQQCHKSKCVIFLERLLKILKCYNFLCMQWWHNCSPAASSTNCGMTLYPLKVHLQTFLSIPITQKCQILICDSLVANEQYIHTDCNNYYPIDTLVLHYSLISKVIKKTANKLCVVACVGTEISPRRGILISKI